MRNTQYIIIQDKAKQSINYSLQIILIKRLIITYIIATHYFNLKFVELLFILKSNLLVTVFIEFF